MTPDEPKTLELRDYLRVLWRRKWTIVVTVIVCVGIATFMAVRQEAAYRAQTQILMEQRLVQTLFIPAQLQNSGANVTQRGNEIEIMNSPKVRAQVTDLLGRAPESVSFTPLPDTDVVVISSQGANPKRVAATANAFAETYTKVRTDLTVSQLNEAATELQAQMDAIDGQIATIDTSLQLFPPAPEVFVQGKNITPTDPRLNQRNSLASQRSTYSSQQDQMKLAASVAAQGSAEILSPASVPTKPLERNPVRNAMAGFAIGVVLGIALAFLREYLDDTVKTKDDLETAVGLTAIGIVPSLADWKKREATPLISVMQPRSPAAEAYRSVRTSVEFLSLDQPIGSIQVTSALASEGKTSTLANLAVVGSPGTELEFAL